MIQYFYYIIVQYLKKKTCFVNRCNTLWLFELKWWSVMHRMICLSIFVKQILFYIFNCHIQINRFLYLYTHNTILFLFMINIWYILIVETSSLYLVNSNLHRKLIILLSNSVETNRKLNWLRYYDHVIWGWDLLNFSWRIFHNHQALKTWYYHFVLIGYYKNSIHWTVFVGR